MEPVTDDRNYCAKSAFPPGVMWRSTWLCESAAMIAASKFCDDWAAIGTYARATVFYRDGSIVMHVSPGKIERVEVK